VGTGSAWGSRAKRRTSGRARRPRRSGPGRTSAGSERTRRRC
jgi:hypothetical protein